MSFELTADHHEDLNLEDEAVFRKVYLHFQLPVINFIRSCVKDRELAEDIYADVMIKLWERRASFNTFINVKAFLFISARNRMLNYISHEKVITKTGKELIALFGTAENLQEKIENQQITTAILQRVHEEVEGLPERQREIFKAVYFEGLSTDEIARRFNISQKAVLNQKQIAVKKIQALLKFNDLLGIALAVTIFF